MCLAIGVLWISRMVLLSFMATGLDYTVVVTLNLEKHQLQAAHRVFMRHGHEPISRGGCVSYKQRSLMRAAYQLYVFGVH